MTLHDTRENIGRFLSHLFWGEPASRLDGHENVYHSILSQSTSHVTSFLSAPPSGRENHSLPPPYPPSPRHPATPPPFTHHVKLCRSNRAILPTKKTMQPPRAFVRLSQNNTKGGKKAEVKRKRGSISCFPSMLRFVLISVLGWTYIRKWMRCKFGNGALCG